MKKFSELLAESSSDFNLFKHHFGRWVNDNNSIDTSAHSRSMLSKHFPNIDKGKKNQDIYAPSADHPTLFNKNAEWHFNRLTRKGRQGRAIPPHP